MLHLGQRLEQLRQLKKLRCIAYTIKIIAANLKGSNLTLNLKRAGVVELVDTQASDACGSNSVEVRVLSSAE